MNHGGWNDRMTQSGIPVHFDVCGTMKVWRWFIMVKPEIFPINLPVMWEFSVTWVGLPCEFFRMTWSTLFQEDDKVSLKDSKPQVGTTS